MKRNYLRFYVPGNRQHAGKPLAEWLLEAAKHAGLEGGSARAREEAAKHAGLEGGSARAREAAVEVVFVVDPDKAAALLELVKREGLQLFYAMGPAEAGAGGA
jgi:hypothetical protein